MNFLQKMSTMTFLSKCFVIIFLLTLCYEHIKAVNPKYLVIGSNTRAYKTKPHVILLEHERARRDTDAVSPSSNNSANNNNTVNPTNISIPTQNSSVAPLIVTTPTTVSNSSLTPNNTITLNTILTPPKLTEGNGSTNSAASTPRTPPVIEVTKVPLLGVNGSGQLHTYSNNTTKVSEPILPDDDNLDVFEDPEKILAEHNTNITTIKNDNHTFYNSLFIVNCSYVKEHFDNITKSKPDIHSILSNSHRRATTIKLSFDFPFYGNPIRDLTVATGGFIYTGDHVHNWLAATQYIAPLMANFDTSVRNDSLIKLFDDGNKFIVVWENVCLQEHQDLPFTFSATLFKNGDITFAYQDVPIPVQEIDDAAHPVKVGLSDAYITDKIMFYVRRKTIYEYHRVTFKTYDITNCTIVKLVALPTCLQYNTCESCVNHQTGFNCSWCEQIQKCSSGTDRAKQDWTLRSCDRVQVSDEAFCAAAKQNKTASDAGTPYFTDTRANPFHDTVLKRKIDDISYKARGTSMKPASAYISDPVNPAESHSAVGGVVAALILVTLISSVAAWVFYAFKNPHTRSGQLLIKYRPTQWSWRRGEARYTAATIHM